jgi:ABC-2 type transport system ATP-binding protein
MNPPALEISALEKRFPKFTLGPVSLTVPTGAIYGLIGPNGAGKTTLLDQIFGIGSPDSGSIRLLGFDHQRDEVALKQNAAYVGPDLNYRVWKTVGKAIRFIRGFRPTWDEDYCARLMKKFELSDSDKIATLSFGGRTKLSLLLALAWHPKVLVLDEPTTGLDAHAKQVVFAELLSIVRDESRTVIISSHQINELERFADMVGILHRGRLLAAGPTSDLVERHLQVEFEAENAAAFRQLKGLIIHDHEGSQWRGVIDVETCPSARLIENGALHLRTQPLTLEELFLALTR